MALEFKPDSIIQYNDYKGEAAADNSDVLSVSRWLKEEGHLGEDESVVGISMSVGENQGKHEDPVYVRFLVLNYDEYQSVIRKNPIPVKVIDLEMAIADFLALFKRFEVAISDNGELDGREFEIVNRVP